VTNSWKNKSIFFYNPNWSNLEVRHFLDAIHVENNVCNRLIETLLNIQGKTMDGVNPHLDLVEMNIQQDLAPREVGKSIYDHR